MNAHRGLNSSLLRRFALLRLSMVLVSVMAGTPLAAMEILPDEQLAHVSGEGIAVGFHNLKATMGPSTYLEATGVAGAFPRADVRWYGISVSDPDASGSNSSQWNGSCSGGALACPIGGPIANLAYDYDPFVLRAFDYTGVDANGTTGQTRTVLELLWPSITTASGSFNPHDKFKLSFWGEIKVNNDNNQLLQSQTIMNNLSMAGSQMRIFQHTGSDNTLGFQSLLRLSGNLRFSVNQTAASPNAYGQVPIFAATEGLYFKNVSTYLPLGQLHYMSIILDDTVAGGTTGTPIATQDGDFVIELTRLPNDPDAYSDFYALGGARPDYGYRCVYNGTNTPSCPTVTAGDVYYVKHGSWRIGDYSPNDSATVGSSWANYAGGTSNAATDTNDGIYFRNTGGTTVNLGDVYAHGITMQHLKITTRGAGG